MAIKSRLKRLITRTQSKELGFTLNMLKKSPLSITGLGILLLFTLIALLAPVLAPPIPGEDPYLIPRDGYWQEPRPPNESHIFGTTDGQFDIFYGCIWGTRTAFYVGIVTVVFSLMIGITTGSISGFYGGKIDELLMRITDIWYALPSLILAMAFVIIFGASLDSIIIAITLVNWPSYARLMRSEVLRVREEDFVEAATAIGCSKFRVLSRHVLPNTIYPVLIVASLDTGSIVLWAAALSFLGLGAPYGYADWGQMIAFSRDWITGTFGNPYAFWYTFTIPGLFIFTFVLGWSLLGDAFRDILDPMIRRR